VIARGRGREEWHTGWSGALAQEADHGLAMSEDSCCVHCDVLCVWCGNCSNPRGRSQSLGDWKSSTARMKKQQVVGEVRNKQIGRLVEGSRVVATEEANNIYVRGTKANAEAALSSREPKPPACVPSPSAHSRTSRSIWRAPCVSPRR
jgi:hypothetical protein